MKSATSIRKWVSFCRNKIETLYDAPDQQLKMMVDIKKSLKKAPVKKTTRR